MSNSIQKYCNILIKASSADSGSTGLISGAATNIQGQWNVPLQPWADGQNAYLLWGDARGRVTVFDFITTAGSGTEETLWGVDYSAATSLYVTTGVLTGTTWSDVTALELEDCMYNTQMLSQHLRKVGDRYIVEGGTILEIYKALT